MAKKSNGMKDKISSGADNKRGRANSPVNMVTIKSMRKTDKMHFADKGSPKK
jgi:hypothetical protein